MSGVQAKAPNPRKITVDLELFSELSLSRSMEFIVAQSLPEELPAPIHVQTGESTVFLPTVVCEKSFSLSEQLPLPDGATLPGELLAAEAAWRITDGSAVAGRYLVKGEAKLHLIYTPKSGGPPCSRDLLLPFSQLMDLDGAEADAAELWVLPVSDYFNLIETIEGQSMLDAELHALIQLRAYQKHCVQTVTDAYSNQMPGECRVTETPVFTDCSASVTELEAQELIELPEEGQELLGVYPTLCRGGAAQAALTLDLLCRGGDGKLSAMRRTLALKPEENDGALTFDEVLLRDCSETQEGRTIRVRVTAEGVGMERRQSSIRRVSSLELDEERQFDLSSYPSLTAVWGRTESIWELAKQYHSSPEAILALNADPGQRPLFLPKTK